TDIHSLVFGFKVVDVFLCCHTSILSFMVTPTPTTGIPTLSLHDALPIWDSQRPARRHARRVGNAGKPRPRLRFPSRHGSRGRRQDRKSTRLNSSHLGISYAVFCLKKKTMPLFYQSCQPLPG